MQDRDMMLCDRDFDLLPLQTVCYYFKLLPSATMKHIFVFCYPKPALATLPFLLLLNSLVQVALS